MTFYCMGGRLVTPKLHRNPGRMMKRVFDKKELNGDDRGKVQQSFTGLFSAGTLTEAITKIGRTEPEPPT